MLIWIIIIVVLIILLFFVFFANNRKCSRRSTYENFSNIKPYNFDFENPQIELFTDMDYHNKMFKDQWPSVDGLDSQELQKIAKNKKSYDSTYLFKD